ncbi:heme ABC exporter ATP-binding protein CcmA [Microvirga sp. BT291]|nr:heme ABC exporter ATP-binding protein CcmA [Microvirga pudoricolor]
MRLSVRGLACERGGRRVFDGVSFTLDEGEALLVTGRNGAGKSSLLEMLAGRLRPAGGRILWDGAGERSLAESLHHVGHRDALKGALTARENLDFARDFLGCPALSALEALEAVGLAHAARLPVGYLSAGQRHRVALARLLVAHRPLWLLDEPTSALDAASQEILRGLLEDHRAKGGLIAATTHVPLFLKTPKEIRIERAFPPPSAGEGAERSEAGEGSNPPPDAPSPGPAGHSLPQRGEGRSRSGKSDPDGGEGRRGEGS